MPALAVGALGSGAALVAWPVPSAQVAVPAPASAPSATSSTVAPSTTATATAVDSVRAERSERGNRSNARPALAPETASLDAVAEAVEQAEEQAELVVSDTKYVTEELNVRTKPKEKADVVETLDPGKKVKVTKTVRAGFRLIENDGDARWVKNAYLSSKKPEVSGATMKPCRRGSTGEAGITKDAVLVHRTLCARYPEVTSFGGMRSGGGFHATGQAIDAMISNSTVGWQMARWLRAHAAELGVSEVIYEQRIWTVQRSGEGWRPMSDRGSVSANHYDHVHISVYGNAATG